MNFGNAGVTEVAVGKQGQFKNRLLHPWKCNLNTENKILQVLSNVLDKFTLMESFSTPHAHHATIIDNKDGTVFEIQINRDYILAYPKTNTHQAASERLFKILAEFGGKLETDSEKERKPMNDDIRFYRSTGEYGFLSNLYRREIVFEGRTFRSSEDAYQFGKPKDPVVAEWLISAPKPHLCAAAAHALLGFDIVPDWSTKKVPRMARIIDAKFRQHQDLKEKLIATGNRMLIEESNTDAFWGIGKKGNGRNMLGILLMATRNELIREAKA